jgi:dienelactone hydrolase
MNGAPRLSGHREPLGLWRHRAGPPAELPDLRAERIEFTSRGDRATGRLWLPRTPGGELPLVLLQHRAGSSASSEVAALAARFARLGAAVAAIDLALHGARSDAKLGALLARALAGERGAAPDALLEEFVRQSIVDLERCLDALCTLPELDAGRVAYAGFGLGARLGAVFCSLDPRVHAVALALDDAADPIPGLDARAFAARIAPRPLLWLGDTGSRQSRAPGAEADPAEETLRFLAPLLGLRPA